MSHGSQGTAGRFVPGTTGMTSKPKRNQIMAASWARRPAGKSA
jgi:hypothetical protein